MTSKFTTVNIGVGMPAWMYLNQFGRIVNDAFGDYPFLVGSATVSKQWRDVDVRLILSDEAFERICGQDESLRWQALCLAFSELGKQMTGLPVDFQIQQMTQANKTFPSQIRCALIGASHILASEEVVNAE